ncbi:MAG: adenylate/guanylate cyclase domain-containing protein [Coleofasciculaceae cyanobacterium]
MKRKSNLIKSKSIFIKKNFGNQLLTLASNHSLSLKENICQKQLLAEVEKLKQEIEELKQEKVDLEILLETTTEHSDNLEVELQNKAEQEKRESQRRMAQFLEAMPVGVCVLDARGKPYYANQKAGELLGKVVAPEVTSNFCSEACQVYLTDTDQVYPHELRPSVRALRGESSTADDLEIRQGDKVIPLEVWGTPIFDLQGKVAYAIIAFQDIRERKQAEAEGKKYTNKLAQLNKAYERFVPRQFLQLLDKKSIVDVQLGAQVQKEMSVLFADIRNFTSLSEKMTPAENFKFINSYLSQMNPAIIENQGFIDKYIGDGIMALFSGEADDALKAGIAMLKRLADYNQERQKSGYERLQIGVGINTGSLMLGTVGVDKRMDSTVVSDAVNLASRLEGLTKKFGVSLLISHQTFARLQDPTQYAMRLIDRLQVKGKSKMVSVFEVFDADPPAIREGKSSTRTVFERALLLYNSLATIEAMQLFKYCLCLNPEDTVARIYLERCQILA